MSVKGLVLRQSQDLFEWKTKSQVFKHLLQISINTCLERKFLLNITQLTSWMRLLKVKINLFKVETLENVVKYVQC